MLKRMVIRVMLWRLNRQVEKLESRFLDLRADMYRREVR